MSSGPNINKDFKMDFRSLIQKIESVDGVIETPKAPELPKSVKLDEDAQLRVLAGTSTILAESAIMEKKLTKAEKAAEENVKEEMKVGDTKKSSTGGTIEKTKTGVKHTAKDYDGEDHAEPAQSKPSKAAKSSAEKKGDKEADKKQEKDSKEWEKKHGKGSVTRVKDGKKVESIDPDQFRSKFMQMVEAAKKGEKPVKGKKAEDKMDEAAKPDFLDVDKDGDKKEPMKKAAKEAGKGDKKDGKKGMTDKQAKYFGKKKTVKESVEPRLSFKEMLKLVYESGGQQQIDPLDKTLFSWAERIAKSKFQESQKAEVYAGLVYERMGGRFEMYDVLSEDQK
jgi:hypothetical protein